MPLDLNTALNAYGFFGQLANSIPDLKAILNQAIAGEWAPEQFQRALYDSPWWKANAESVRNLATLQATDPATYNQNLGNASNKVLLLAKEMGRSIDPGGTALLALLNNWDDQQLRAHIGMWGGFGGTVAGEDRAGSAAQIDAKLRQLATNYGVAATGEFIDSWVLRVQSGYDTVDGFDNLVRARAKAQYPHLANQIDSGMTVRDIADPYIASYAQTLELPESGITLQDPAIMKALQNKNPDGTFSTKPMYEFVRQLKDDPRWDKTKNAEDEAYRFANRLGRDMGFLS